MKHNLSRRAFIQGATAFGLAAHSQALCLPLVQDKGSSSAKRSVVVIYLRGGADFLNMLVPLRSVSYELKRPGIWITPDEVIKLDSHWGLHPALASLLPLYQAGEFLPIIGAGSPHPTRSHFDAQDFMGYAAPGDRTMRDGWLNRYLTATHTTESNQFRALGMQRLLPTSLRGEYPVLAVPEGFDMAKSATVLSDFERFYGKPKKKSEDEDGEMDMGGEREGSIDVVQSGQLTIETLRRFKEIIAKAEGDASSYPNSDFGKGMRRIAQVIRSGEGVEVAGIDIGGWDHHANQGAASGSQAGKLKDLADTLVAFRKHLGDSFDDTVVMVMTEFGRTVMENGSGGTDHGHGSGMFLFGGGLKGGTVFGEWNGLKSEDLYQNRDLLVTTDFRDVFNTVLAEHLDFKAPKGFFPDYKKPKRLKLFA
ncbi:MAG: hypothetical protein ACI8X5_003215 [Planctomycetota bacterium]|jgi:uncharacterized protein (DUF1501 family)